MEEFAAAGRPWITAEVAVAADFVRMSNVAKRRGVGSAVVAVAAAVASADSSLAMTMSSTVGTSFAAAVGNYSRCCCCCLFDDRWYLDWVSSVAQPASAVVPPRRGPNPISEAGPRRTPVCVGRVI